MKAGCNSFDEKNLTLIVAVHRKEQGKEETHQI
jgi:hypothetical protein